jgi:choline dehydrogenase-like flavoprotein
MIRKGTELMEAAGASSVRDFGISPALGWHLMGAARMGSDPAASVVDADNQAHDVPNLFIADSTSLATGGGVNPTSTIQAVALRCAEGVWEKRRELG